MHGKYVSYMYFVENVKKKRHSTSWQTWGHVLWQGRDTLYLGNLVKSVYGKKSCLCVRHKERCLSVRQTTVCSKINVLNLLKFVPREFLIFVKTGRFLLLLFKALFFNETSRKSAWAKTEVTSISYRQSCHWYSNNSLTWRQVASLIFYAN